MFKLLVSLNSRDLTFKGRFVYLVVVEVVVIAVIVLKFGPQLEVVLWWTKAHFLCFKSPLITETEAKKLIKFCNTSILES